MIKKEIKEVAQMKGNMSVIAQPPIYCGRISAATVKKSNGCGDKGSPESLSPAAQ